MSDIASSNLGNFDPTVHYADEAGTADPGDLAGVPDVPNESATPSELGSPSFSAENAFALNVFERASHDFNVAVVILSTTSPTFKGVGRVKGRKNITLSVPTSYTPVNGATFTPAGVIIGPNQGAVDAYSGYQLNPGDSVTIATEAPVYIGSISGASSTAVCQIIEEVNPLGGSLGAF